ncbi:MAG: DUF6516 family protein [Nitrospirota bacterium]
MQIRDYLESILDIISASPYIESKSVSFEERPPNAAYINGILTFINGSKLHFKEFIVYKSEDIIFLKYAYHYLMQDDTLIFRYDNALDPKAKAMKTYPEHKHLPGNLLPAKRPSIEDVLKEISNLMDAER